MCLSVLSFSYSPIKPPFAMLTYSLFFCNRKLEISRSARISSIILQNKDHKIICFAKQGHTILIFPVKTSSDYYFFLSMNYNDFPASASFILLANRDFDSLKKSKGNVCNRYMDPTFTAHLQEMCQHHVHVHVFLFSPAAHEAQVLSAGDGTRL